MRTEQAILEDIVKNSKTAVLEMQHFCALNGMDYVAKRISAAMEEHQIKDKNDYVVRSIFSACPKCASQETSIVDFRELFRDGSLICKKCKTYIRYYDAS